MSSGQAPHPHPHPATPPSDEDSTYDLDEEGLEMEMEGGTKGSDFISTLTPETDDSDAGEPRKQKGRRGSVVFPTTVPPRQRHRFIAYETGMTLVLILVVMLDSVYKQIYLGYLVDGQWWRLIDVATLPIIALMMLFSTHFCVGAMWNIFGPIRHISSNSTYYSAVPTAPPADPKEWPSFTVQIPVYTESLDDTIIPSVISIEKALRVYRSKGGKASLFINDDGLQVINETERARRIAYYEKHGIAYIARPPHSVKKRRGLFKKASNMNYSMNISLKVNSLINEAAAKGLQLQAREALYTVWSSEFYNKEFLAGGDVRMGDLILLVDADTRVPTDCLYKTVGEFVDSPNLGYTQHFTHPFGAGRNYWDAAISHFTKLIYFAIMFSSSLGDPAPLVGHNAILRWSAIQQIAKSDPEEEGNFLFWAVDRVSEDFDMSFRLQCAGFVGRYVTYTGAGFMEGVSLSVHDEITRLKKYAFGACEMVFNILSKWLIRTPLTKHFRAWLFSRHILWHAKVNIVAYLFTYFALASAIVSMCINIGLWLFFPETRDAYYTSLEIQLTVLITFSGIGIIGITALRWRINYDGYTDKGILYALTQEFQHMPVIALFWICVPFHLSITCFRYFLGLKIKFGATAKEKDETLSCCGHLLITVGRYKFMYMAMLVLILALGGLLYMNPSFATNAFVIVPPSTFILGHIFGPYLLDPDIMRLLY